MSAWPSELKVATMLDEEKVLDTVWMLVGKKSDNVVYSCPVTTAKECWENYSRTKESAENFLERRRMATRSTATITCSARVWTSRR